MYTANVVRVMIASPGDVEQEREIIRRVIQDWNAAHSEPQAMVLLPIAWDTDATPEAGARPQTIINKQLLTKADLLVGVFWTRIGSPTGAAVSGTVEEIKAQIQAGKPAMVYFSERPVSLGKVDLKQYESLQKFRKRFEKTALVEKYADVEKFREKFSRQLGQKVNEHFVGYRTAVPDPERTKYREVTTTGGARVWLRDPDNPGEPPRYACPNCWSVEIMPLQPLGELSGKFQCPRCDKRFPISPARPFPDEPVRYARTSPNIWEREF